MTARLKPHPAAELFPVLPGAEIDELAEDIKARGQLHKGVVLDGLILDGRHREEACHRAGVVFAYETWSEVVARSSDPVRASMSPTEWVLSTNLRRRHLNETQRAVIGEEALPLLEAEAKKRMMMNGGDRRSDRAAPRGAARFCWHEYDRANCTEAPGHSGPHRYNAPVRSKAELAKETKKGKAAAVAAKAVGASTRSVERAKAVLSKRPELRQVLKAGKQTLKQAEKAIRKEEQLKNVLEYRPPVGTYAVIVADPSWKYKDQLDGSDQARGGTTYPPMELEEICAMQVGKKNAAPDCALWLWATKDHLMDGSVARVLDAWGFEGKQIYTWRKVDSKGNDRLGTGHYGRNVTEFVILAVRGKPLVQGGDQPNIFDAPRTARHSEKPARFFEIAERVTPCAPEARIEMFAIGERKGWVTTGSEQQAKVRGKLSSDLRAELEAQVRAPVVAAEVVDDGTLCGVRPSKNGDGCIHKQGHEGIHSNGKTTWRDRKRKLLTVDYEATP